MFAKLTGKAKTEPSIAMSLEKLSEQLDMLEKKERTLQKKAAAEFEKAKQFNKYNNKRAAMQAMKMMKMHENQIISNGNQQLRIHDLMIMLEGAKSTTETVDALRTGAAALKAMQKAANIDDVEKTLDEVNEQTENMKLIQEALLNPMGGYDFDEEELEAELEELECAELEQQLLKPAAPVQLPTGRQPNHPIIQKPTVDEEEEEEDELAALQAEMAL